MTKNQLRQSSNQDPSPKSKDLNMQNSKFAHENKPSESLPQAPNPSRIVEKARVGAEKKFQETRIQVQIMQNSNFAHENRFPTSTSHFSYLRAKKKTYDQTCKSASLMTKSNQPPNGSSQEIPEYAKSEICPRKTYTPRKTKTLRR
jgi:hypothetical protein